MTTEKIFKDKYNKGAWLISQNTESKSGTGSTLIQTMTIRQEIPKLLKELSITSMLDASCGDFNWMKELDLTGIKYLGIDIVNHVIEHNQKSYGSENISFDKKNIITDPLPKFDIILCRDCLVHLPHKDVITTIKNLKKSGSTYLLTTTFTNRKSNSNIRMGDWRPINLTKAPFNLPSPLKIINEQCTEAKGKYQDKCLGLWKLDDILLS